MITRRVLAAAAGAMLGFAAAWAGGAAGGSASFNDPAGDAQGAPDVTALAISDDPATGLVRFTLTASGMTQIDPELGSEVNVFVDTDRNPATGSPAGREFTGSPAGAEYRLSYEREADGSGGGGEYWNGTSWVETAVQPTMSIDQNGGVFTWQLSRSDLGATAAFDVYVGSELFSNHRTVGLDRAPEDGVWSYVLSAVTTAATTTTTTPTTTPAKVTVKPLIGAPTTLPGKPVAGARTTISFRVTRSDNGKPLTAGRMTCDPSVGGKVLPHAESFRNGIARLTLTIPRTAEGKLLKIRVTIAFRGTSTTRLASFRVG